MICARNRALFVACFVVILCGQAVLAYAIAPASLVLSKTALKAQFRAADSEIVAQVNDRDDDTSAIHGNYDTSTDKCAACHSAHHSTSGYTFQGEDGENHSALLFGGSLTGGCEYCHTDTAVSLGHKVYKSNGGHVGNLGPGNSGHAIGDLKKVPASQIPGTVTLKCTSCHSVHGTSSDMWKPVDFFQTPNSSNGEAPVKTHYKLLRLNPARTLLDKPYDEETKVKYPDVKGQADSVKLRDLKSSEETINQFTLAYWCSSCHDGAFSETNKKNSNHLMSSQEDTASTSFMTGHKSPLKGIYTGGSQCYICHRGGLSATVEGLDTSVESSITALMALTSDDTTHTYAYADDEKSKLRCTICHYGTSDYATDQKRLIRDSAQSSDWPHTSTNDVFLLGDFEVIDSQNPFSSAEVTRTVVGGLTEDNDVGVVCGRCHVTSDGITFDTSYPVWRHSFRFTDKLSFEETETLFSPGWEP